jgi:hypothetical protein
LPHEIRRWFDFSAAGLLQIDELGNWFLHRGFAMKLNHHLVWAAAMVLLAGCQSSPPVGSTSPSLHIAPTHSNVKVNESVTVQVRSENTLGQRPKITWSTNLGTIKPVAEGMLDFRSDKPTAMFSSDKAGTAIVTATLSMDNGQTLTDSTQIQVEPQPQK